MKSGLVGSTSERTVARCAKTLVLTVLEQLVSRALMASNVTAAVVFRCVDKYQPSLLVDEADTFLGDKHELRGILNSGHRRGGKVLRVAGDDLEPRAFQTFAPVAIALIGKLRDTLADRSIEIEMRRKKREEKVEALRPDRLGHLEEFRRCCARWVQDHLEELRETDPDVPSELHDRAADNCKSSPCPVFRRDSEPLARPGRGAQRGITTAPGFLIAARAAWRSTAAGSTPLSLAVSITL